MLLHCITVTEAVTYLKVIYFKTTGHIDIASISSDTDKYYYLFVRK